MPAVNSAGEDEDRPDRQPLRGAGGGEAEQPYLGRRIEAEPEQEAERKHVPAARDEAEYRPEDTRHDPAAGGQQIEIFVDIGAARLDVLELAPDRDEDDEVRPRDGHEKERRHERADEAADVVDPLELPL